MPWRLCGVRIASTTTKNRVGVMNIRLLLMTEERSATHGKAMIGECSKSMIFAATENGGVTMEKCDYCREDRDGYVCQLPRDGIGNAFIRLSPFYGPLIEVSGPKKTKFKIKIKFCPMCGRELEE